MDSEKTMFWPAASQDAPAMENHGLPVWEPTNPTGKTIAGVEWGCYPAALLLAYTDGSYTYVRALAGYDNEVELESVRLNYTEFEPEIFEQLGLASVEDLEAVEAQRLQARKEDTELNERDLYAQLRRKYDPDKSQ